MRATDGPGRPPTQNPQSYPAHPADPSSPAHSPQRPSIRAICIDNGRLPKPLPAAELAKRNGLWLKSVLVVNAELRREGLIRPSLRQRSNTAAFKAQKAATAKEKKRDELTMEQLVEGILEPDGRRRVLSRLARSGPEPVQVSAVRALEDMDRQTGRQVGPTEPVTDEEWAQRLGRNLYAAGEEIGQRAIAIALEGWRRDLQQPRRAGRSGGVVDDVLGGLVADPGAGADGGGLGPSAGDGDAGSSAAEPGTDSGAGSRLEPGGS